MIPCRNCKKFRADHFTNVTIYPLCRDISIQGIRSLQYIPMDNLEYLEYCCEEKVK